MEHTWLDKDIKSYVIRYLCKRTRNFGVKDYGICFAFVKLMDMFFGSVQTVSRLPVHSSTTQTVFYWYESIRYSPHSHQPWVHVYIPKVTECVQLWVTIRAILSIASRHRLGLHRLIFLDLLVYAFRRLWIILIWLIYSRLFVRHMVYCNACRFYEFAYCFLFRHIHKSLWTKGESIICRTDYANSRLGIALP